MKNIFFFLASIVTILSVFSCKNEIIEYNPKNQSNFYYPIAVGSIWTYKLDSIIYDNSGTVIDTFQGIVKETIIDSFENSTGDIEYTIERANKEGDNWHVTDIWSTSKTDSRVYRTEDNLKFIKMISPVEKKVGWDGNAFIDTENTIVKIAGESIKMFDQWHYRYTDVGVEETIGENTYDDIAIVQQVDKEDVYSRRFSIEKYAKNIGLVYKKMIILNTNNTSESIPWEQKAEEGFILEQKLISYVK